MDKGAKIIDIALEPYKPIAAEKVQRSLCAACPDKRCKSGARCNTYALLVHASAWALASGEKPRREGGEFGYSSS